MRTIYREQKRIKYWTSWPLENYQEKKFLFIKQKARLYDRKPVGKTRVKKIRNISYILKNDTLIKKLSKVYSCQIIVSLKKMTKSFYRKLYTSPVAPKNDLYGDLFFPDGSNTLILNVLEQQECGGPLTETECWEV